MKIPYTLCSLVAFSRDVRENVGESRIGKLLSWTHTDLMLAGNFFQTLLSAGFWEFGWEIRQQEKREGRCSQVFSPCQWHLQQGRYLLRWSSPTKPICYFTFWVILLSAFWNSIFFFNHSRWRRLLSIWLWTCLLKFAFSSSLSPTYSDLY